MELLTKSQRFFRVNYTICQHDIIRCFEPTSFRKLVNESEPSNNIHSKVFTNKKKCSILSGLELSQKLKEYVLVYIMDVITTIVSRDDSNIMDVITT